MYAILKKMTDNKIKFYADSDGNDLIFQTEEDALYYLDGRDGLITQLYT